jgi:hypothetical protein
VSEVSTEVDRETETIDGREADDGVRRDVGTEGEGEDDWPGAVAERNVGAVVADHRGKLSVSTEGVAVSDAVSDGAE